MGRPSNKAEMQAIIVEAMCAAISTHGYAKASIKKIAEVADISPGLIHHHFPTKLDILLALSDSLSASVNERYNASIKRKGGTESLDAYVHAFIGFGPGESESAVNAWAFIASEAIREPRLAKHYQKHMQDRFRMIKILLKAETKLQKNKELSETAAGILSVIEGAYLMHATMKDTYPKGYALKSIRKITSTI